MIVRVPEKVYGVTLTVVVGPVAQLRRVVMRRHGKDAAKEITAEDDEAAFTWCAADRKCQLCAYIWLRQLRLTPASEGVFVHELSHLVDRVIDDRGREGGEDRAYLSQYYWSQAMTKLRKAMEKRHK